jgi:hypothetical protein
MAEPSDQLKTPPVAHDLAGTTVGRFMIRNRVGAGGMGQVYAAEDTTLKRRVAIKRMAPQLHSDPRDLQRFLKEAQRASALNHPNIAAIYDVLENEGEVLLVIPEAGAQHEALPLPGSMAAQPKTLPSLRTEPRPGRSPWVRL